MLTFPKLNTLNREKSAISQFSTFDARLYADITSPICEKNMSARSIPILATRQGRSQDFKIPFESETILGAYSYGDAYILSSYFGTTSLYCGDNFSSLKRIFVGKATERATSLMLMFDNDICLFNFKDSETGTNLLVAPIGALDFPNRVDCPDFVDVTVYKDRVFGCRKKQVRACACGDVIDWNQNATPEDIGSRSYLKNFAVNSEFTACTTYKNRVIFFNDSEMFELSGSDSDDFDMVKIANIGCVNRQSVCEIDGVLYFVSREGVMSYTGTAPKKISASIDDAPIRTEAGYDSVIGGASGVLRASFDGRSGKKMYVYDIEKNTWAVEDDIKVLSIVGRNGETYFVTETEVLSADARYQNESDADEFDWQITTRPIYSYTPRQKRASTLEVYIDRPKNERIDISISFDGGEFRKVYTDVFSGARELSIPLPESDFQKMQIKIEGKGQASIHYIGQTYIQGGQNK